jgi:hypothetical protein
MYTGNKKSDNLQKQNTHPNRQDALKTRAGS